MPKSVMVEAAFLNRMLLVLNQVKLHAEVWVAPTSWQPENPASLSIEEVAKLVTLETTERCGKVLISELAALENS
jgi:hypothetical protein